MQSLHISEGSCTCYKLIFCPCCFKASRLSSHDMSEISLWSNCSAIVAQKFNLQVALATMWRFRSIIFVLIEHSILVIILVNIFPFILYLGLQWWEGYLQDKYTCLLPWNTYACLLTPLTTSVNTLKSKYWQRKKA